MSCALDAISLKTTNTLIDDVEVLSSLQERQVVLNDKFITAFEVIHDLKLSTSESIKPQGKRVKSQRKRRKAQRKELKAQGQTIQAQDARINDLTSRLATLENSYLFHPERYVWQWIKDFAVGSAVWVAQMPLQACIMYLFRQAIPKAGETSQGDAKALKAAGFVAIVVAAPLLEELLFRQIVQKWLLTSLPTCVIKKINPALEWVADSKLAKCMRIGLTSALFSAVHLVNRGTLSKEYVIGQLVVTFVSGFFMGALREYQETLGGSIGLHMANNAFAFAAISLR